MTTLRSAQSVSAAARAHALSLGAAAVVVMVMMEDGSWYAEFYGTQIQARGLLELGGDALRNTMR